LNINLPVIAEALYLVGNNSPVISHGTAQPIPYTHM